MRRFFKTYEEAWAFVHELATLGYDPGKRDEACEAFRMIYEAVKAMDESERKAENGKSE